MGLAYTARRQWVPLRWLVATALFLMIGRTATAQTIVRSFGSAVDEDSWKQVGPAWFTRYRQESPPTLVVG